MATKIKYTKLVKSFKTQDFGNLMRGRLYGTIDQSEDGTWNGWVIDADTGNDFRLGFANRAAATRWVNAQLKKRGVE